MNFQRAVDKIVLNPKKLFLIDAFGALLSAFLLGVVLARLESIFGIPKPTLYFLAFLPCFFAVYDIYCFTKVKVNIGPFLKGIAYLNVAYCCISLGLVLFHFSKITVFGWVYISSEILIVMALVSIELKVAARLRAV